MPDATPDTAADTAATSAPTTTPPHPGFLERLFHITQRGSTVGQEVRGGFATFGTGMAVTSVSNGPHHDYPLML